MNKEQVVLALTDRLLNSYPKHRIALLICNVNEQTFDNLTDPRISVFKGISELGLPEKISRFEHVVLCDEDGYNESVSRLKDYGVDPFRIIYPREWCQSERENMILNLNLSSIAGMAIGKNAARSIEQLFVDKIKTLASNLPENCRIAVLPFGKYAKSLFELFGNNPSVRFLDNKPQGPALHLSEENVKDVEYFITASLSYGAAIRNQLINMGVDSTKIIEAFCVDDPLNLFPLDEMDYGKLSLVIDFIKNDAEIQQIAIVLSRPSAHLEKFLSSSAIGADITGYLYRDLTRIKIDHSGSDSSASKKGVHELLQVPHDCVLDFSKMGHQHTVNTVWLGEQSCQEKTVKYVFPYANIGHTSLSQYIISEKPVVYLSTTFAGSGRITPVLSSIAQCFGKTYRCTPIPTLLRRQNLQPDFEIGGWLANVARTLNHNEVFDLHTLTTDSTIKDLANVKEVNTVVVMRDPRDLLTSISLFYALGRNVSFESIALNLLDSLMSVCKAFKLVLDSPHMFAIRFEDVHKDATHAFRTLLAWLNWEPNLFYSLSDEELQEAIKLGSIEFQTGGLLKRGGEGDASVFGIRKGVTGDWVNHWTPELLSQFVEKGGHRALVSLGYESDDNWIKGL